MRRSFLCSALLSGSLAVSPAAAQLSHSTHRQLAHMERTAQTSPEYRALAAKYADEAVQFALKAEAQMAAYTQAVEHPIPGGKYPTAADTSRHLAEYYQSRADQARAKQNLYESKLR